MAFIPVPNGIELCFLFTLDTQNWQFCLTLRKSAGAPLDTDLQQATGDGYAWWTSALKALVQGATTLSEIVATDLTSQGAPQFRQTVGEAGTASGSAMPGNVAAVISHRTAKRGRSYRGRSFLSGLSNSVLITANRMNTNTANALVSAFGSLRSTLDGHGFDHVVASRQHNGATTSPAEVNEVISYVVDTAFDSQRRRLAGRGS